MLFYKFVICNMSNLTASRITCEFGIPKPKTGIIQVFWYAKWRQTDTEKKDHQCWTELTNG